MSKDEGDRRGNARVGQITFAFISLVPPPAIRRLTALFLGLLNFCSAGEGMATAESSPSMMLEEFVDEASLITTGRFVSFVEIDEHHWETKFRIGEKWKGVCEASELTISIKDEDGESLWQPIFGHELVVFLKRNGSEEWRVMQQESGQVRINDLGESRCAMLRNPGFILPIALGGPVGLNDEGTGIQIIDLTDFKRLVTDCVDFRYSIRSLVEMSSEIVIGKISNRKQFYNGGLIRFDLDIQAVLLSERVLEVNQKLKVNALATLPSKSMPICEGDDCLLFLSSALRDGTRTVVAYGRGYARIEDRREGSLALMWRGGFNGEEDKVVSVGLEKKVDSEFGGKIGGYDLESVRRAIKASIEGLKRR